MIPIALLCPSLFCFCFPVLPGLPPFPSPSSLLPFVPYRFHDSPNDLYENGVGGLIAYANQYCWANSFGKLANGKYLVLQIWETSADLEHQGAAFTPWCMGGTADAANTARWVAETDIVSYTFGK